MASKIELELLAATDKAIADLRKAQQAIEGVGDSTGKSGKKFGGFADTVSGALLGINQGLALAQKAGQAMKAVFDFAEEGAQIEFTATKFDRLARSVGTTADALMGDLKAATGGLMSEMELTASATDFLTLGLAKSHDEAVRLTSVAGQLGMNMNQLVLTLTNQTTMRFDALGIAVAGFDEKVDALKATGMSANDAFNEAFLQQAEEQIEKVGSIADSSAADFMKFTAATEDLVAEWKKGVSEGGKFLGVMTDFVRASADGLSAQDDLNEALENGVISTRDYEEGMALIRYATDGAAMAQTFLNQALAEGQRYTAEYSRYAQDNAIATYEFSDAIDELAQGEMDHYLKMAEQGAEINQRWAESAGAAAASHADLSMALKDASALEAAKTAIDLLGQAQKDNIITSEEYAKATRDIGIESGLMDEQSANLAGGLQAIVQAYADGAVEAENMGEAVDTVFASSSESAEEFATTLSTILPTASKTAEDSLTADFKRMKTEGLDPAGKSIGESLGGLLAIDGMEVEATVVINTVGSVPNLGGGGTYNPAASNSAQASFNQTASSYMPRRASGGPTFAGQAYLVGEQGPEVLQMGSTSGRVIANNQLGNADVVAAIERLAQEMNSFPDRFADKVVQGLAYA